MPTQVRTLHPPQELKQPSTWRQVGGCSRVARLLCWSHCWDSVSRYSPLMRTEPMVVEGLAGPVVLDVNAFTGKHSVTVGVQQVRGTRRGNYTLPTLDGRTVPA